MTIPPPLTGVALLFDRASEIEVLTAWQQLELAGVTRSMIDTGLRPHVTLGVCESLHREGLSQMLDIFATENNPLTLELSSLGMFLSPVGVIYLGATPTQELLALHAGFQQIFASFANQSSEYYQPGKWVPHCTLGYGLDREQCARSVQVLSDLKLPLRVRVEELALAHAAPIHSQILHQVPLGNQLAG